MKINFNGSLVEASFATENRAFKFGDAVFDTSKYVYQKLLFWEEHYLRLMAGMRILRMEIPISFTMEFFEGEVFKLLEENRLEKASARVRITVFRKSGGLYTPSTNEVDFIIEVQELKKPFFELNQEPYEVELFKDFYINPDLLANVKHTNKAIHIIGSVFAQENDYQNCLLLNNSKNLACALNGNLFMVEGNTIKTPPLTDGCLNGITRQILLKILKKTTEFDLVETSISPFELQKADELFISNSIVGIQPVTKYRKKMYSSAVTQNLIGKLNTVARFGFS
ncbi:aminotransferase class IV [Capnocytophaga canimorsus]|uniref:aminotransferase class IV n=1 Tax=Capnocytophaga canimorsus TaxID=28188 RepID=UPI001AC5C931|nr:aminotransferase class IV [Capnocytophaga canimorsus]GIM55623.1 aminotransferase class IV [Capnocytophaga canimorsus]